VVDILNRFDAKGVMDGKGMAGGRTFAIGTDYCDLMPVAIESISQSFDSRGVDAIIITN
jgi:hypothetical protein